MSKKSVVLVLIQFFTLFFLLFTSSLTQAIWVWPILIMAILLGLFAIWTMRQSRLRIQPEVAPKSILVQNGLYKWIRHPMYLSVILLGVGLLLTNLVWWRVLLFIILVDDLRMKMKYEETLLAKHFGPAFETYKSKTKKLIPFLY